jgi:hypothetical protein
MIKQEPNVNRGRQRRREVRFSENLLLFNNLPSDRGRKMAASTHGNLSVCETFGRFAEFGCMLFKRRGSWDARVRTAGMGGFPEVVDKW